MIGPKKLSTIRQELSGALAAAGLESLRWLEERMNAPERRGHVASGESEVLQSLRRILEATERPKRGKQRIATPK
ncbi:MAG TPA: hypothetical protein VFE78_23340 [Gemmataceae bacterium]|nr:hypothetical protein [Gemmataceae bacterium]